jgi:hypothetical protein
MVAAMTWSSRELRLTKIQADFLRTGQSSVHQRIQDRTEIILEARRMFAWRPAGDGTYYRGLSPKGQAAIKQWNEKGKP